MQRKTLLQLISLAVACNGAVAEPPTFDIRLIQNDAPSPTLFSCDVSVNDGSIVIRGSRPNEPVNSMFPESMRPKIPKFENHVVTLEDTEIADDFLTIAKHFELCHEGTDMMLVSGGTITKITCIADPSPAKNAYYIAVDPSKRMANQMEDLCHSIRSVVVQDVLNEQDAFEMEQAKLKDRAGRLASRIERYVGAFELLNRAYEADAPIEWTGLAKLAEFRPDQPPLEERTRLVQTAHAVLTAFSSKPGLQHVLSGDYEQTGAAILKIGGSRRCRGYFSFPLGESDWGFDDIGMSLGLTYPPADPALPVGILDMGLERLLLHFILQEGSESPTAYDRYALTMSENKWEIVQRPVFKKEEIPKGVAERLQFLTAKSGLLAHLLKDIPENVVVLDLEAIVIENDDWIAARIDYRLGEERWILPFFLDNETWTANRPWGYRAYRSSENAYQNRDFFRSRVDVEKHNGAR